MDRWDKEFALHVVGTPLLPNPKATGRIALAEPIAIYLERPDVERGSAIAAEKLQAPRRRYVTKKDLEKHGYTKDRPVCNETSPDV